jgi:hypothetical protein
LTAGLRSDPEEGAFLVGNDRQRPSAGKSSGTKSAKAARRYEVRQKGGGISGKTVSRTTGRFVAGKTQARVSAGRGTPSTPTRETPKRNQKKSDSTLDQVVEVVSAREGQRASSGLRAGAKTSKIRVTFGTGQTEIVELTEDLVAYRDALITELERLVLPGILVRIAKGAASVSPRDLARRMLAIAPAPAPANKMAEQVGPEYYDTHGVSVVLAKPGFEPVSKQAVEHRRRRHTILALQTQDGRWIYPTWQFVDHEVLPGLAEVLGAFYATSSQERSTPRAVPFSAWSIGTWLTTPRRDLDDLTAVQWLQNGCDRNELVELARQTGAAWAA